MQWWNNFVDWFTSEDGWRILSTIVFPFLAIIVAGFIAAMIGRSATRRLLALHDREQRVSTVAALIGAARRASKWNSLSAPEQQHAEHLAHDADVSIRLLPLPGAAMTADWAAHEITEMKKNSVSFSFQAEQSLMDFRDRLVEWQSRPSRAKKLFKADLDLWAYESAQEDKSLVEKQQEWAKKQVATETGPVNTAAPESKAISWETPAPATPAQSAPSYTAPTYTEPNRSELTRSEPTHAASAQPAASVPEQMPAAQRPPERPTYGLPAATTSFSNEPAEATNTGEQEQAEIPSPVSAQTVRQRVLPDSYDEDDLR
ncbi:MAG TPA: hypothetical protein VFT01_02620 [Homoserinimonas sp.]|nr:hypothetical protein [Homoserinimonas sp.]